MTGTMRLAMLARTVLDHAHARWNHDGWDIIYESWTLEEVAEELEKHSVAHVIPALKHFEEIAKLQDERRREIESTKF